MLLFFPLLLLHSINHCPLSSLNVHQYFFFCIPTKVVFFFFFFIALYLSNYMMC